MAPIDLNLVRAFVAVHEGGSFSAALPDWLAHAGAVYLVYPSRRHVPHRVTAFRDLVLEMLRHRPLPTL